jgi:hypothetical protein
MKIEVSLLNQVVIVNDVVYTPEIGKRECEKSSEVVIVGEVKAVHSLHKRWLYLGFLMPDMEFRPGEKIRIIKEQT